MDESISLEVITATETAIKENILELYIHAYYGEAGILENHLPYISILKFGEVAYKDPKGKFHYLYIENGFMEVRKNNIVIISDLMIKGENLNPDTVSSELGEIDKKIKSASKGLISAEELKDALAVQSKLKAKLAVINKVKPK